MHFYFSYHWAWLAHVLDHDLSTILMASRTIIDLCAM